MQYHRSGFTIESVEDLESKSKDILLEDLNEVGQAKPKGKREKKSRIYFGRATEEKIEEYLNEKNSAKKEQIFKKFIYPKLYKLSESIIYSYGFDKIRNESNSVEELVNEVISDIVLKGFPTLDPTRGRAFSYFSKIAKNYLSRKLKYEKRFVSIPDEDDEEADLSINTHINEQIILIEEQKENEVYSKEFLLAISNYFEEKQFVIVNNVNELKVVDALIEIFQKYEHMNISFKKQAQDMIRDLCPELSNFQIKTSLRNISVHYEEAKNKYIENNL